MKIVDILPETAVVADLRGASKLDVLQELAAVLAEHHRVVSKDQLVEVLLEREKLGSTAIGEGIAIPHGKLPKLTNVVAAFGRSRPGIDFNSLDGGATHLFFLLVAPEDSSGAHLKALARVSRLLRDKAFRERLLQVENGKELYQIIREEDEKY
ncbi:MAG: PTS sugar transporter subunit IIA [Candidatus Binatia bacterium]